MPGHFYEYNPEDEVTTRRGNDTLLHPLEKATCSKYSSTSDLSLHEQLKRQAKFRASTQDEA